MTAGRCFSQPLLDRRRAYARGVGLPVSAGFPIVACLPAATLARWGATAGAALIAVVLALSLVAVLGPNSDSS